MVRIVDGGEGSRDGFPHPEFPYTLNFVSPPLHVDAHSVGFIWRAFSLKEGMVLDHRRDGLDHFGSLGSWKGCSFQGGFP